MHLLDVNVWLALAFGAHQHHASAKLWFAAQPAQSCMFCRLTQQGFLRLASNPAAVGDDTLTLAEAWQIYDALISDERVRYAPEPAGLEEIWRRYTQARAFSNKAWNDAYLAAFAQKHQVGLVTFDRGFAGFDGLGSIILE